MNIPITKAVFDEAEALAVVEPLKSGWVVQGPYVEKFEKLFAEHCKVTFAKAVSSCTTALHLALVALGVGAGDKVIVPSFTYVASANAVEYTGAEVVFCDIELATFNIDVLALEKLLANDPKIKAIMPVNLFGLCADMPQIMMLAKRYNCKIVEDSACGFDAYIDETHSGTFADVGCFSFHPRKAITTGEGGMVVTNDENLFRTIKQLSDHGASKSDLERHKSKGGSLLPDFTLRGYNYRMTDIQGAVGVCQMQKAESIMKGRRLVASWYDKALEDVNVLMTPIVPDNYTHAYQSYVCLFSSGIPIEQLTIDEIDKLNIQRNQFMAMLEEVGIATRQGTHAVHTLTYYKECYGLNKTDFIRSYAADRLSVTLPLYANMREDEFDYVITQIKKALV